MEVDKSIIKLEHFTVSVIEKNILLVDAVKGGEISAVEVKQIIDSCILLSNSKPYHSILDMRDENLKLSEDGRKFYKEYSEENSLKISQSVVYDSLGKGLMLGAIMKMVNYVSPHKFFFTVDSAVEWIKETYK